MKKTTINTILLCIIAILSVSICFLIFCIVTRPRYVAVNESGTALGTEVVNIMEEPQLAALPAAADDAAARRGDSASFAGHNAWQDFHESQYPRRRLRGRQGTRYRGGGDNL